MAEMYDKLQTSRQDKLIAELEDDLEAALSKLQSREKELELWKERVERLTKVSFVSASGDPLFLYSHLSNFNLKKCRHPSAYHLSMLPFVLTFLCICNLVIKSFKVF